VSRAIVAALILALSPAGVGAQNAPGRNRGPVLWAVAGAGAGFGIGTWVGLSVFDDAVNSDRKVWTSAIVGASVGGVAGYLIGRARRDRARPSTSTTAVANGRLDATDPALIERLVKSVRISGKAPPSRARP
jgi:hypothetical protein